MHNDLLDKAGSTVSGAAGTVAGVVGDVVSDVVSGVSNAASDARAAIAPSRSRGSGKRVVLELLVTAAGIALAVMIASRLVRGRTEADEPTPPTT